MIVTMLGALVLMALPAIAHHAGEIFRAGNIRVSHAHVEAPTPTAHGVHVYLTVENTGDEADRLTAASVDFANPGVFQTSVLGADGTLSVRDVKAIAIAPGQSLMLEPGAARIAFDDVGRILKGGEVFDMTLTFERAGTLDVEVLVEDHDTDDQVPDEDDAGS
jgi:hypothetical protein